MAALAPLTLPVMGQVLPDAGSVLKQAQPIAPPAPSPNGTGLTIQRDGAGSLPPSAPFLVSRFTFIGNKTFSSSVLNKLVASAEGSTMTLAQLGELTTRVTRYYQDHGYPLARAIVPAQTVANGVVTIQVVEATYGKITLDNQSRVSHSVLVSTLAPLQSGQLVAQADLDRVLLLMSDIPAVVVGASLKPSEQVGSSDLLVNTKDGPPVTGYVTLDNYGGQYTGRARISAGVSVNNPVLGGDVLSLNGMSSGDKMNYGRVGYDVLLNGQGTRMGGSYSALYYRLGASLGSLQAHGTAQVLSAWAKQPLVRSRDANVYAQVEFARSALEDHIDTSMIRTDRHLNIGTISLSGDIRDALMSSAVSTWSVAGTAGRVAYDDDSASIADAASAKAQGGFAKWVLSLSRQQSVSQRSSVYLSLNSQWASTNLDSSQKMSAGGPYGVRAYDAGAVSGDSGYGGTAEFRYDIGAALSGQWQAVAFVDSSYVHVNKSPWINGRNSTTLSGVGVGLNWLATKRASVRAYIAAPIGANPSLVATPKSARAWLEASVQF